ncbi:SDR family oxidoreductase [Pseudonocardia broussonetiae]|uniref:SDR family oxidoreductase n=1 Tax=Pseudonocardia broussonetiae TaxID=2736640 RepID=A0A6M6JC36_9PSEU|nr:SDR family oxidoreductase [Pseudonocardia broussonetiae]QJY45508.1 SDR family oxidoreductase [Pseudonocardia broussonetiae]
MTASTVLVVGATGTIGSAVLRDLRRRGVATRAFVRDRARARAVLGDDVELATGDLADPSSVRAALRGVQRVLLCTPNDPEQVRREVTVIDAAAAAGVGLVVKIGAIGAGADSPLAFWVAHARIEQHLRSSGLPAVVLHPSMYMTNLLAAAETIGQTGRLFAPAGDARISLIDPRDVAATAAVVLTEDGHAGRAYTLTGPEALTYQDVAAQIASATGRPVEYVEVPDAAARAAMAAAATPDWFADQLIILWGRLRQGAGATTTDTVRVLTGQEPRRVAEFVRDRAHLFGSAVAAGNR